MEPNRYVYRFGELTLKDFEEFTKIHLSQEAIKKSVQDQNSTYNRMIQDSLDWMDEYGWDSPNCEDYFIKELKDDENV